MGVTPGRLAEVYPRLYHMAEANTWDSIQTLGILSTSALLTRFGVTGDRRDEIEARRRPNSVPLTDEKLGRAVIRDQNPLIESKLIKTLKGCTAEEWYRLLNGRVFFWLTVERLNKLLCAKAYRGSEHTVLTVDTRSLVSAYKAAVTLTPMNTGNTQPFAHPRGPDKSMKLQDYPFDERAKYGRQYQVVEIAIEHGVTDIKKYVISAETLKCAD
jgi:hypothetical protein